MQMTRIMRIFDVNLLMKCEFTDIRMKNRDE